MSKDRKLCPWETLIEKTTQKQPTLLGEIDLK
jgi:hypothetical protein